MAGQATGSAGGRDDPHASPEYKGLSDTDEQRRPITNGVARIFYLPHTATVQDFQEIANAFRTVIEIRRIFTYNDGRAMAVRGTPVQMGMAEWLVTELNQNLPGQSSGQKQSSSAGEYRVGDDDSCACCTSPMPRPRRIFRRSPPWSRTMAEIRRMFTVNTLRAVLIRSTPDQWRWRNGCSGSWTNPRVRSRLSPRANIACPARPTMSCGCTLSANAKSVQDFQAIANAVRTATEIRRVFTYNAERALAVRGTVNQLALAENLIHDLDGRSR